jgi:broad specificity phosphatase PhoE
MTIYLLRHGDKADGNFHNPVLKHQDQPLSEKGVRQAAAVAAYFEQINLSAIYVSAYLRTLQTARATAARKDIQPVIDARLNEIDNGAVDEMSESEFAAAYPETWKQYAARTEDFLFPDGESGEDVRKRISDFLLEKIKFHTDQNILVVSHDGLIRICMTYILGIPVYRRSDFKVGLCGLTRFDFQEDVGRWKLYTFNQDITGIS